jgi:transcriptional regulator GlxA family with amidase domain
MHKIAVLAFDGVVGVDLVLPAETFRQVRLPDGRPGYDVKICGVERSVKTSLFRMDVPSRLAAARAADTIIVPGVESAECAVDERLLTLLRRSAARGVRIASVCSGALVLARTGLLDGKRATTHWAASDALQARHPEIEVDPAVLYVDNGQLLTSAGGMAQLDLCLHMIRRDYGAAVAAAAARTAVMPLERSGGQAQFITHEPPVPNDSGSLCEALEWMQRHLDRDLSVTSLARRFAMSERTFARRFREQTGTTPAKWVARARVAHARTLLETTPLSIERVAEAAGFCSSITFRERFRAVVGVAPLSYRKAFRG